MAGLLTLVCALHVLGGVARAGVVGGQKKLDLFQNTNSLNGGGCGQCDLDKMVKDCPLDVMFMLDMSDSVSPVDYQQAQNYVARQITSVANAFQGTQVGFLAFSNIVHTDIPLQPRSSQELVQVANTVRSLPQQRYGTKLAGALRHARESLAAHNGTALVPGGRRGKLIVLVSDGCPDDDRTVKKEAVQAELDGMAIVSVTLDDEFMGLLRSISLQVLELRTDIDWRSVVACPATFLPPINNAVCGDFVVAMDGSDSVRRWEKVMRDYLAFTAMLYDNQYNAMGVVVFGTNATSQSSDTMIKPIRDKLELVEQIEKKLSFPNERGTGTTQAIREATAFLRELAQTGSSALSRSLVIITDGPALHPQNARQALADARAEGFQVVVIGVGDAVTAQELQVMAGQQSVVVRVDSYLKLFALKLSDYICQNGGRPGCTTPCPAGKIQDPNTCTCSCPSDPQCNGLRTQDPSNCQCACRNSCLLGQYQDPFTCQCGCNVQCTPPQTLNLRTCQCQGCQKQCTYPQVLNQQTCQCGCQRQCTYPQVQNQQTCQCECQRQCTYPQVQNQQTCQCECQRQCPYPQVLNQKTCQCGCSQSVRCTSPQVLNSTTCQCECQRQCNYPQVLNQQTCQCECQKQCTYPQVLNQQTCQCECQKQCTYPQVLNQQTCQCECQKQCTYPQVLNQQTCQCECQKQCTYPQVLNQQTCQCECQKQCTYPQVLNQQTCQCGCQNQCTYPQVLNQQTCQCGCQKQCTNPQVLNRQTCQCVSGCQKQCTYPQVLNQQTCQCECQNQCTYPQVLNQQSCQCECTKQCTYPQVLNQQTCQCECQKQCTYPQVLNKQTCQCGCQKQCTYPQGLNQLTCQCECKEQCSYPLDVNEQTCQCECQKQCTYPQVLNQQTCQCVSGCQKQCTYPQGLNQLTCQCECKKQCSDPLDVNEQTCQCECQKQCTYPQVLNQQTCQCESKCTNTVNCAGNQKFNKQTYQCECTTSQNCNVGQFFNQFSCSCEWTTAPTWQPITTAPTWQPWTTAPTWQPRSTGSPATSKCSAANYRCQNNQPAVEDCQGRCICQCDRSLYAGFYCDLPIRASLCDNCTHINGHYLAGVEGRCDLYVVCQPTGNSAFLPHITQCPPGTIFKQDGRLGQALCDHPSSAASCPTDPCKNLPPYAKYSHSRTCNHYWQCDASGRTGASYCCPPGQGFDKTRGECIADANCPNDCDPNYKSCNGQGGKGGGGNVVTCPLKAAQDDPRKFYHIFGPKGLFQSCAPTDVFNDTLCLCMFNPNAGCAPTYDYNFDNLKEVTSGFLNVEIHPAASLGSSGNVAKFGGHSRIILYRFSASGYNIPYFEISLRVKLDNLNLVPGQEMAIVSNGDCGGEETLTISVDQQYVYFKVKTSQGSQPHIVKVPYGSSGGWLDIKFQYENKDSSKVYVMTGTVNGQSDSVTVIGVIGYTKCALQVGHGQGLQNLTGYVDDFKVWKCKPNGSNVNNRKGSNNQNGGSTTKNGGWNTRNGGFTTQNGGWNTRNGGSNTQNGGWNTRNGGSNTQNGGWNTRNGGSNTQNGWNTRNRGSRNTQNRGSWGSE